MSAPNGESERRRVHLVTVLLAVITILPATMTSCAALLVALRTSDKVAAVHTDVVVVKEQSAATGASVDVVRSQVVEVKTATDGMKDALVAAALKEGRAEGAKDEKDRRAK